MAIQQNWDGLLAKMIDEIIKSREKSNDDRKKITEQIDKFLCANLSVEKKNSFEEILFEYGLEAEKAAPVIYAQGVRDCVWVLREIGVIG